MVYATPSDMIDRFGQAEMIRLTTEDGAAMTAVDTDKLTRAIAEAQAQADTFLRKRYDVPLTEVPLEIRRVVCIMARYDLAHGESREPSEQVRLARKEAIEWLGQIARGEVELDLDEVQSGSDSFAIMSDRTQTYGVDTWP